MNIMRIKALVRKEFIQIFRDYRSLWMAIAIPVVMMVLFGYALTLDVDNVPLAVWDQDKSSLSRDFILNFNNSKYFKMLGYCDDYRQIEAQINKNKALMALIIPKDFSHLLKAGKIAPVQLLIDGSDSNTASIALGYAEAIVLSYNKTLVSGALSSSGGRFSNRVDLRTRVWFNETLLSRNFIIPGLIAVIMMIVAALLASLTVAREWERGTMEQLISTPIKPGELIIGKFIPYFLIGIIDIIIVIVMGKFLFHVPFRGNLLDLFIFASIFLTGVSCWGILISIITKNQFMACQLSFITTFLPAFLLSGFAFPIANMPEPIQLITYIIPARYFVTVLKGIYLKGIGFSVLWPQALFLLIFCLAMILLAKGKFKKKVA
ncbi:MAG TPA: ABC transporter permease [Candidatus Omnitrophota bacterium]|nr:ABC transporter permease [Candidatus Omnitrophota bacterium]HPT06674.1 ABC transporter permease [Candidatus Omnitrophota bacterium]